MLFALLRASLHEKETETQFNAIGLSNTNFPSLKENIYKNIPF